MHPEPNFDAPQNLKKALKDDEVKEVFNDPFYF
jgi:hypothetical protein